jgi:hypothetical protein
MGFSMRHVHIVVIASGGIVILDWTTDWREWEQQMGWGERVFVAW